MGQWFSWVLNFLGDGWVFIFLDSIIYILKPRVWYSILTWSFSFFFFFQFSFISLFHRICMTTFFFAWVMLFVYLIIFPFTCSLIYFIYRYYSFLLLLGMNFSLMKNLLCFWSFLEILWNFYVFKDALPFSGKILWDSFFFR